MYQTSKEKRGNGREIKHMRETGVEANVKRGNLRTSGREKEGR